MIEKLAEQPGEHKLASEPTVDHERIHCVKCMSTNVHRVCESRKPLNMRDYKVRWYRRQCRECGQKFVTKEKDYSK